jgi:uncharacterized protein
MDKRVLEDLYLPYRPKRRTKATIAREKGLDPLAQYLWQQEAGALRVEELAATFVNAELGVANVSEALEGARHILAEQISETVRWTPIVGQNLGRSKEDRRRVEARIA